MAEGPPDRLVWTGRFEGAFPGGLDGWSTTNKQLMALAERAAEVVVLDPLSFPWTVIAGERRDLPLTAWLPPELDADDLILLLGRTLLRHLTPYDHVVEGRPEVRERLEQTLGVSPEVWLAPPAEDGGAAGSSRFEVTLAAPRPDAVASKGQLRLVALEAARDLRAWAEHCVGPTLVGTIGRARQLLPALSALGEVQAQPPEGSDPGPGLPGLLVPAPGAVVVWLEDGGSATTRRSELAAAVGCLHPGGHLLVIATVVDEVGGAPNPRISELVEELLELTGGGLHVRLLKSVRWGGEQLSRGVVLGSTVLGGGRQ